jgi:transketolase
MATGSEIHITLEAAQKLASAGVEVRVVSMPCWNFFDRQSEEYRESVLPGEVRKRIAVETGGSIGWERYVGLDGAVIGMTDFGASAPIEVLMEKFGFTSEHIVNTAMRLLQKG